MNGYVRQTIQAREIEMIIASCIPITPSRGLGRSLRFWVEGLEFSTSSETWKDGKLLFCMLQNHDIWFMLNQRAGEVIRPTDYEGIRLYWTPKDIHAAASA